MIIDYYAVLKEIRSFAANSGLGLEFKDRECVPCTDGKKIIIQRPDPAWGHNQLLQWRASIYHELGHNDKDMRDIFDVIHDKEIDMRSLVGGMINVVDDYRQEKHKLGDYVGRDTTLSKGNGLIIKEILEKKEVSPNPEMDDRNIIDVMQGWSTTCRTTWQRDLIGLDTKWEASLNDVQKEKYQQLRTGYSDRLNALETAEDEYQLVMDILDNVFERDSKEEEEKAQQSAQQQQVQGQGGEQGEGEETDAESQGGTVKFEDLLLHDHGEEKEKRYGLVKIDYSTYKEEESFKLKDIEEVFYKRPELEEHHLRFRNSVESIDTGRGISNKIRKLLLVRTQKINVYGQKKGKIANKSIYKAALKNTGSAQQKVFRKKEQAYDLDVAISVLVDNSGSMDGERLEHAAKSAVLLSNCANALRIPVEVVGFTEKYDRSLHHIYREFSEHVGDSELLDRLSAASADTWRNADGESILWAYSRLKRQEAKRKLLIVLSDGQPNSRGRGNCKTFTEAVVKNIERENLVEIYGIGLMSDAVENYYTNQQVIWNANELEATILNLVKNYIIK